MKVNFQLSCAVTMSKMNLSILKDIQDLEYQDRLSISLFSSSLVGFFRKQVAIIHETLDIKRRPTSFVKVGIILGGFRFITQETIGKHYSRYIPKQHNAQKLIELLAELKLPPHTHNILQGFKRARIETFYEQSHMKVRVKLENCDRVRHLSPLQSSQTSTNSIHQVGIQNICEFPDKHFEWNISQQVSFLEDQTVYKEEHSEALTNSDGLSFSFAEISA
jgi:hypothetical protein